MPASQAIEHAALKLLFAIQRYVTPHPFTPLGLSKGFKETFGLTLEMIEAQIQWLKERGYVAEIAGSTKLRVTHKSWTVEDLESSDATLSDVEYAPPAKTPEHPETEDSPDDGADSFIYQRTPCSVAPP